MKEGSLKMLTGSCIKTNCVCFPLFTPPRFVAPLISMRREEVVRGVYELRPHRERNQTFLNAETG